MEQETLFGNIKIKEKNRTDENKGTIYYEGKIGKWTFYAAYLINDKSCLVDFFSLSNNIPNEYEMKNEIKRKIKSINTTKSL